VQDAVAAVAVNVAVVVAPGLQLQQRQQLLIYAILLNANAKQRDEGR